MSENTIMTLRIIEIIDDGGSSNTTTTCHFLLNPNLSEDNSLHFRTLQV